MFNPICKLALLLVATFVIGEAAAKPQIVPCQEGCNRVCVDGSGCFCKCHGGPLRHPLDPDLARKKVHPNTGVIQNRK